MRLLPTILLAVLCAVPVTAQQSVTLGASVLEPATTGGIEVVDRALVKLSTHRRLLVVGAHPDDEDTTLLAFVGAGLGGEAAYLSLSRGEGGQNLIGPELGIGLGLIRTGELLAARQVEGTRQFFTRAYDFGYTRSLSETFARWPHEILLEDAVRVVRTFKPQIIVAIFPPDERAGHGQHQAAGVIAQEVFEQAGLPDRFPELTDIEFLPPWQPQVLYRRVWRNREEATFQFPLDSIEPFSGRSVLQIAGASRSKHRSQDMGTLQPLGSRQGGLIWLQGEAGKSALHVFDGVDTSLAAIADLLPPGALHDQVETELDRVAALATETRDVLSPSRLGQAVPALIEVSRSLDELLEVVREAGSGASRYMVVDLLAEKREVAAQALAAAAGIAVDAVSDREVIEIGETFEVTATVWNSGAEEVAIEGVDVSSRQDWVHARSQAEATEDGASGLDEWHFEVRVPEDSIPTVQHFLARPLVGDLYDWGGSDEGLQDGLPLQQPPVAVSFRLAVGGVPVNLHREVVFRVRDQAIGEVRRPLRAVPEIEVIARPSMVLWATEPATSKQIEILVTSHSEAPSSGRVTLAGGEEIWPDLAAESFQIDEPEGQQVLHIELPAPGGSPAGRVRLTAIAELDDGREFAAAYPLVSYEHIRPMPLPVEASIDIQRLDLGLPAVDRIGYVRGASDRVPEVLLEIGLPVELLTADDLRTANLAVFDTIVIGSRAYETRPALAEVNGRLLEYVEEGGLLVVQYQQYQFVRGGFAPLPLEIGRPHGRVTDETAPVEMLVPEHTVFVNPNRITAADWSGWVQERGLYFASEWDTGFESLLSLRDEGQPVEKGALLVATVGKGLYVYTGLSFFRQLPAGVPGAIRLFVNLLSMERP